MKSYGHLQISAVEVFLSFFSSLWCSFQYFYGSCFIIEHFQIDIFFLALRELSNFSGVTMTSPFLPGPESRFSSYLSHYLFSIFQLLTLSVLFLRDQNLFIRQKNCTEIINKYSWILLCIKLLFWRSERAPRTRVNIKVPVLSWAPHGPPALLGVT